MKAAAATSRTGSLHENAPPAFIAADTGHGDWCERPVHLTPRQREVLSLLCEGLPNKLICRRLNISTGTVKVHIGSILKYLGVSSRLQAVVSAQRLSGGLFPDRANLSGGSAAF
jgi:DNA-binding CsgD family transcriptional regulator